MASPQSDRSRCEASSIPPRASVRPLLSTRLSGGHRYHPTSDIPFPSADPWNHRGCSRQRCGHATAGCGIELGKRGELACPFHCDRPLLLAKDFQPLLKSTPSPACRGSALKCQRDDIFVGDLLVFQIPFTTCFSQLQALSRPKPSCRAQPKRTSRSCFRKNVSFQVIRMVVS